MYFKIQVPLFRDQKNSSMIIGYGFILENLMIIMACNWFYFKNFTIVVVNVCIISGWRACALWESPCVAFQNPFAPGTTQG